MVPVLQQMPGNGIPLGEVLADSGYAHRAAEGWAVPLRTAGARLIQLIQDLTRTTSAPGAPGALTPARSSPTAI